jgi:myo-inositol-1(or 4)-monophosphatase
LSEHEQAALMALAVAATQRAGGALLQRFGAGGGGEVRTKSTPTDPVSDADIEAQRLIRELIALRRPDDGFLGEEEEGRRPAARPEAAPGRPPTYRWVVDPLDGTVNFLFGIPQWCVSVAVQDRDGRTLAGAIFDPAREELFSATADGPASLAGRPLGGPAARELGQALVATGFYYEASVRASQARVLGRLLPAVRDIRRLGSAALDLAWTAAGRYDAYFERGVKLWDIAAGELICRRAGLAVRTLPAGRKGRLPAGILVARPGIVDQLAELLEDE